MCSYIHLIFHLVRLRVAKANHSFPFTSSSVSSCHTNHHHVLPHVLPHSIHKPSLWLLLLLSGGFILNILLLRFFMLLPALSSPSFFLSLFPPSFSSLPFVLSASMADILHLPIARMVGRRSKEEPINEHFTHIIWT